MERDGLKSEKLNERGRQQMLCGVLLHVIEAARPINLPVHRAQGNLSGCVMNHPVVRAYGLCLRIDDFDYRRVTQPPQIMRLASGGRIESRLVQYDLPTVTFRLARHD